MFYIESNLFCASFLVILLIRTLKGIDLQLKQVFFVRILFFYILYSVIDVIWILFEVGIFRNGIIHYILNLISYVVANVSSYYWFIYSETTQGNRYVFSKKNRLKLAIPLIIIVCISLGFFSFIEFIHISSFKSEFYFYYYLIMAVSLSFYIVAASLKSFSRAYKKENLENKDLFLIMGFYPLIFITGAILQSCFLYIPILCYVVSLDLLCVYLSNLDNLISVDSLTKLNNRNQFNRFIDKSVKDGEGKKWLFFIDVDNFKYINDTYGHLEGDKALVVIANALKLSCKENPNNYFISRYGGDEFIIMVNHNDIIEPKIFKKEISDSLKKCCKKENINYKLSVSVGDSLVDFKKESIESCLKKADKRLYLEKRHRVDKK